MIREGKAEKFLYVPDTYDAGLREGDTTPVFIDGVDPAGSAATVQGNLEGHTGLTTTAHGGIVASTDPRLTDARPPTTHATTHATAGSDPITPAAIGAEVAGAAATVQGNLTAHINATGAGVHGAGATGSAIYATATQDAARAVLGLGAVTLPPRRLNHTMLTMTAVNTGSGTGVSVVDGMLNLLSGTTGTSTTRLTLASNAVMYGRGASSMMWSRRNVFVSTIRIVVANAEGICRLIFGKQPADAFGLPASGNYIAVTIENDSITGGSVCKAGVLTAVSLTTTAANGTTICIIADNGTANFYANSVLIGSTTNAPTANGSSGMSYELQNGSTAANYQVFLTPESECN